MMLERLRCMFPAPRFLAMEGGGVEISSHSIKYVHLDADRAVIRFGEELLPKGIVRHGDILDREALVQKLRAVRARCGFSFAHASLPEQKGYLFDLAVPRDDAGKLNDSVIAGLSSHVPLQPAEAIYDCEPAGAGSEDTVQTEIITVFPESTATEYARAFADAGFTLLSFELEPQAAIRTLKPPPDDTVVLVDYGGNKTILSVARGGAVRFTTSTEGTASADEKIAASRKIDENSRTIVDLKIHEGLAPGSSIAAAMGPAVDALASEIRRLIVYWQSHGAGETIQNAVLYGDNANLTGLPEALARLTNLSVRVGDVRGALGATVIPPIPRDEIIRFATVIGLALRSGHIARL